METQVIIREDKHHKLQQELLNEKSKARAHEKTISDFVSTIQKIVQKKDEKQYI